MKLWQIITVIQTMKELILTILYMQLRLIISYRKHHRKATNLTIMHGIATFWSIFLWFLWTKPERQMFLEPAQKNERECREGIPTAPSVWGQLGKEQSSEQHYALSPPYFLSPDLCSRFSCWHTERPQLVFNSFFTLLRCDLIHCKITLPEFSPLSWKHFSVLHYIHLLKL